MKYAKPVKAVLSVAVAVLLFLCGQYTLLAAKAAAEYGDLPSGEDYRTTSRFSIALDWQVRAVVGNIKYDITDISRTSKAFERFASVEDGGATEKERLALQKLFQAIIWLRGHQPEKIYVSDVDGYLSAKDYADFIKNKQNALGRDEFPYPVERQDFAGQAGGVYIENRMVFSWEIGDNNKVPSDYPSIPYLPEGADYYEYLFANYRYSDQWQNYMKTAVKMFLGNAGADAQEAFNDRMDTLTAKDIDAFFTLKKQQADAYARSEERWLEYKQAAEAAKALAEKPSNMRFAVRNRQTGYLYSNFASAGSDLQTLYEQTVRDGQMFWYYYKGTDGVFKGIDRGEPSEPQRQYLNISDSDEWTEQYDLFFFLPEVLTVADEFAAMQTEFTQARAVFLPSVKAALVLAVCAAAIGIYLIVVAGRKSDSSLALLTIDRMYHDIHFVLSFGAAAGLLIIYIFAIFEFDEMLRMRNSEGQVFLFDLLKTGLALAFSAAGMLVLEWLVSASRNIKNRHFIKHTVCFKLLFVPRWMWRKAKALYRRIKALVAGAFGRRMTSLRKWVPLAVAGYVGVNTILLLFSSLGGSGSAGGFFFLLFLAFNLLVFLILFKSLRGLDSIMGAARSIRGGGLNTALDLNALPEWQRDFAKDILDNQEGLRNAVADAVKNERMKAELITNVSHDLKTPLTSIVSYVSLLKTCDITDADALNYIAVLDDKAERLKKLIEDLVEASKASTGNIPLNMVHVNLYELAVQAVGENSDDLEAAGIDCRIAPPAVNVVVWADGQRTWRIIDNLFSNAKKYTMPNTRVYVDVKTEDGCGVFTMKNISRTALNIAPEELTQRFVRGDEARGGEGSGLGLSIAKSLCELQGGSFQVEIDGDLFKATVRLPLV